MARLALLAAAVFVLGITGARAQDAAEAPPPDRGGPQMHGPMEGHGGWRGMHHARMGMLSKAAAFRFKKDGAEIDIKCAVEEPTRACVDAAGVLIDKVNGTAPH